MNPFTFSEEADDVFNESVPMRNCSFASLSQKIDDQRFDLLKRRQSYSEFEDLIEKKVRFFFFFNLTIFNFQFIFRGNLENECYPKSCYFVKNEIC